MADARLTDGHGGDGHVHIAPDSANFAKRGAAKLRALLEEARSERGTCTVALAGGNTPRAVYERLILEGGGIEFFFGDERCVPPDHADSNYRMAVEALGTKAGWRFHRIEGERADRDAAARDYERVLPRELDVVVLGIGEDAHTASLFPGAASLAEETRRVIAVQGPKPPPWRITITPPVIASARSVLVLATGEGKAAAVARCLEGPWAPHEAPAQLARRGLWMLDAAAGSKLRRRKSGRH